MLKLRTQARAKGGIDPATISQLEERVNGAEQAWRQAAPEYLTVYQAADFRRLTSMKEVCTSFTNVLLSAFLSVMAESLSASSSRLSKQCRTT